MEVQAELNPLVEGDLRLSEFSRMSFIVHLGASSKLILPGAINVTGVLGLHSARLMIKHCLYHTISDRLEEQ